MEKLIKTIYLIKRYQGENNSMRDKIKPQTSQADHKM